MRIGAHVSVAGGLANAVANAVAVGCESFQVFVSNARGWAPPPLDPAADERFRAHLAATAWPDRSRVTGLALAKLTR